MDVESEQTVLLVSVGKLGPDNEEDVVRIERKPEKEVATNESQHVVPHNRAIIVVKKAENVLHKVKPAHVQMEFTAHLFPSDSSGRNVARTEQRLVRFWFDIRELDRAKQIKQTQLYFKHLIRPEGFPKDYAGFIKKAVLLAHDFVTFERIELVLRPARPLSDSSDSEEDDVITQIYQRRERAIQRMRKWEIIDDVSSDEDFKEETLDDVIDNYITVLTPNKYDYQCLPEVPVSNKRLLTFRVRAQADAHIALSSVYAVTEVDTYEIVLGAAGNTKSFIRDGGEGPIVEEAITYKLLDGNHFKSFWIRWSSRILEVGAGVTGGKAFLRWVIPRNKHHSVNCLAVSTGPGSHGEWEFVEKIAPEPDINSAKGKSARKVKIRLALLWEAKRMLLKELLEEAYPRCLKTMELLRLSKTKVHDMMRAVSVLRSLLKTGHVLEISKGRWMASHTSRVEHSRYVRVVSEWPSLGKRDAPLIALITHLYCEKIAVDVMMDSKVTYFMDKDGDHFPSVEQVYIVGIGGGVPNYTDYDRHVRLGDVVVSLPDQTSRLVYLHCNKIDKRASFYQFKTMRWIMKDDILQGHLTRVRDLGENPSSIFRSTFDKILQKSMDVLICEYPEFNRPPPRTDKLYGWIKGEYVPLEHPKPRKDKQHLHRDNRSNFRYGTVGSGKYISKDEKLRMDLARQSGIMAFDANCCDVLETLTALDIKSYAIIRGISDYFDGSVNKQWRHYAALAAAAYVTMFLGMLPKRR